MEMTIGVNAFWCQGCHTGVVTPDQERCSCGKRNPHYKPKPDLTPWTPRVSQPSQAAQAAIASTAKP